MPKVPQRFLTRGFTFVELMLGMVVTSIVLGALVVFTFAVGENWKTSDATQSAFLAANIGVDRLNQIVRSAQAIGSSISTGSLDHSTAAASCLLWTDDNLDGKIEYSEITLLLYDQANQRLMRYEIPGAASNAGVQVAALMTPGSFLSLPNVVGTPVVHNVSACEIFGINTSSSTIRPSLEFVMQMQAADSKSETLVYCTATLRGPNAPS